MLSQHNDKYANRQTKYSPNQRIILQQCLFRDCMTEAIIFSFYLEKKEKNDIQMVCYCTKR